MELMKLLPQYWHDSLEMQEILREHGIELDSLKESDAIIFSDAFIMDSSEERIQQWERSLQIVPKGNLLQRKYFVLATLRGSGKLDEAKIKSIVSAFTGGDSVVTFANGIINILVYPPQNGESFLFPDIERAINPRKPAHLGLNVKRFYSTWGDIKEQFADWNDVATDKQTWRDVYNHIERL